MLATGLRSPDLGKAANCTHLGRDGPPRKSPQYDFAAASSWPAACPMRVARAHCVEPEARRRICTGRRTIASYMTEVPHG
jgi:hypothetical protein